MYRLFSRVSKISGGEEEIGWCRTRFFGPVFSRFIDYKYAEFSRSRLDCKIWTRRMSRFPRDFETGFSARTEKHHYPVESIIVVRLFCKATLHQREQAKLYKYLHRSRHACVCIYKDSEINNCNLFLYGKDGGIDNNALALSDQPTRL
jgi:hypothetical protein